MKKLKIWSLMLMVMISNLTVAQNYTEFDLVGVWTIEDISGYLDYYGEQFFSHKEFEFTLPPTVSVTEDANYGETRARSSYNGSVTSTRKIYRLSISHNNVLRMNVKKSNNGVNLLTIIISSINSDTMVWTSMDGGLKVTLKKIDNLSNVAEHINASKHSEDYYNLQGVKVENPKKNEVYINNGKKIIK